MKCRALVYTHSLWVNSTRYSVFTLLSLTHRWLQIRINTFIPLVEKVKKAIFSYLHILEEIYYQSKKLSKCQTLLIKMACFDYPSINHVHFAFCLWFKQINGNVFLLSQNVSNLYGTMWVIISRSYDVILLRSKTICLWLVLFTCLTFSQKWRDRHWKQNKGEQISAFAITAMRMQRKS